MNRVALALLGLLSLVLAACSAPGIGGSNGTGGDGAGGGQMVSNSAPCLPGFTDECSGTADAASYVLTCFDLQTDPANCGACGNVCKSSTGYPACSGGVCATCIPRTCVSFPGGCPDNASGTEGICTICDATIDDGCGGKITCGACSPGQSCWAYGPQGSGPNPSGVCVDPGASCVAVGGQCTVGVYCCAGLYCTSDGSCVVP